MNRISRARTTAATRHSWSRPLSSSRYDAALRGIQFDEDIEFSSETDSTHRMQQQSQVYGKANRGWDDSLVEYLCGRPKDEAQRASQRACAVLVALFLVAVFAALYG
ncbi:MAG: hypothetical protein ACREDZ_06015 [Kiloniellales bacterium]